MSSKRVIFEPLSVETLSGKAYNAMRDSILTNKLLPGQSLSIEGLANDLGVSPTPVREALVKLTAGGLVEWTRNKQARVTRISEDNIRQTFAVRNLIEPHAAGLAAQRVSTTLDLRDAVQELQHTAEKFKQTIPRSSDTDKQYRAYIEVDLRLHEIICEAQQNTLLKRVLKMVANHSLRIRSLTEASAKPCREKQALIINQEHLEIVQALLDGDAEKAREAVQRHLRNGEARTLEAIKGVKFAGKEVTS